MAALGWLLNLGFAASGGASVTVTGTATGGITEAQIGGSRTIIGTVIGDTLVATFGDDNSITTAFLAGITSDGAEGTGWNAVVRDTLTHANVVRDSNTQFTVTLEASYPTYDITADETITVTIPSTAFTGGVGVVGSPAFGVSFIADERRGGGVGKRRRVSRYPRRVLIDGVVHWAASAQQERALLAAHVEEVEREALTLALEQAPPAQVRQARVRVRRAANRLVSVDNREQEWIERLIEEDDELILAMTLH